MSDNNDDSDTHCQNNLQEWLRLLPHASIETIKKILSRIDKLKAEGREIYPEENSILRALELTSPKDVKAIIIGQDPYHGEGQADGLAFSVQEGTAIPPSLRNIFKELHLEYGAEMPKSGDLTFWAEQGVLLLNSVLTVEKGKPGSHKDIGWQKITEEILRICFSQGRPMVVLCFGSFAETLFGRVIEDFEWYQVVAIKTTHPSPFSANRASGSSPAFIGSGVFKRANSILSTLGVEEIQWVKSAEETTKQAG